MVFLKAVPILGETILPFAPINLITLIAVFFLLSNYGLVKNRLSKKSLFFPLSFFLIYYLLLFIFSYMKLGPKPNIFLIIQNVVLYILVIILDWNYLVKLVKFWLVLLLFECAFSMLIYFIGEPFATLRLNIVDNSEFFYIGQFERLSGFSRTVFLYAYPVAIIPLLLLVFFKFKREYYLLPLIFFSYLGILLNGERITFALSVFGFSVLLYKWFWSIKQFGYLIVFVIIAWTLQSQIQNIAQSQHSIYRLRESSSEEFSYRMLKQWTGVATVLKTPFQPSDPGIYQEISIDNFGTEVSSPHNQFINMGINAGVWGWIIIFAFLFYMFRYFIKVKLKIKALSLSSHDYFWSGLHIIFWVLLGVGFFHNGGLFDFENAEYTSFCLLMAFSYQILAMDISNAK